MSTKTPSTSPVTIYAVAERAGVSTATVSRTFANNPRVSAKTRERVLEAARELDYLPTAAARALAGRRTRALGLVLPHISGPYYADLLVGFEVAASELGLSVVLTQADPASDSRRAVHTLATQVDGLAFMGRSAVTDDLVARVGRNKPVVTVARTPVPGHDSLFAENREPARELTQHLISHGRTRIGFVGPNETGSDIADRYQGWLDALTEAGLEAGPLFSVPPREDCGFEVAEELLDAKVPVDALVCGNDELALALTSRLQRRGVLVPTDVAITGWDDTPTARYITPGLTTIAQPVQELGRAAATRLAELIQGREPAQRPTVLPVTTVYRESCGCSPSLP